MIISSSLLESCDVLELLLDDDETDCAVLLVE